MRTRTWCISATLTSLVLLSYLFTCSSPTEGDAADTPVVGDEPAIRGTLTDSGDNALPGVLVTLVGDSVLLVDTTDSTGAFAFGPLDSGTYYLTSGVSPAVVPMQYDGSTTESTQVAVAVWPVLDGNELSPHTGANRTVTPVNIDTVAGMLWPMLCGIVDHVLQGLPKTSTLPRQTIQGLHGGTAEVSFDMRAGSGGFVVSTAALLEDYSDDGVLHAGGIARSVTGTGMAGEPTRESHDVTLAFNGEFTGEVAFTVRSTTDGDVQFSGTYTATGDSTFSGQFTRAQFDAWRSAVEDTSTTGDSTGGWMEAGSGMALGAQRYMPLTEGATWTYRSGVPAAPGTYQTYTVTAAGLVEGEPDTYYRELSRDDGKDAALYRCFGGTVYKYQRGAQLPTALQKRAGTDSACGRPFFVFGVPAGTRWQHFSISDTSNPMLSVTVEQSTRYVGLEEVSVAYGTLPGCARFDIATTMVMGTDTSVQGMSVWLAPHVGIVRMERGTVLEGALVPYQVDELVATSLGVGDTPESTSVQLHFLPFTGGELQVRNWRGDLFTLRAPALSFTTEGTITMTTMVSSSTSGFDSCLSPGVRIDLGGMTPRTALELTVSPVAPPVERGTAVLALTEPSPLLGLSTTCAFALDVDTAYAGALCGEVLVDGVYAVVIPAKAEVDAQVACVATQGLAKRAALGSYGWISLRGSALSLLKWA
ncbi:MAG: hypothetical protein GF331_06505, partial [Chitinivibrionales bacterium]|nr:hypothetical protein [Chitinivibrionales bacterium]